MKKAIRSVLFLFLGLAALIAIGVTFFGNWILKNDVPVFMRTLVYMLNPPERLLKSVAVGMVNNGEGSVRYVSEYYGKYAIYLSADEKGRIRRELAGGLKYEVKCIGGSRMERRGTAAVLPELMLLYETPADIPLGSVVKCTFTVDAAKNGALGHLFVKVNKLFDI